MGKGSRTVSASEDIVGVELVQGRREELQTLGDRSCKSADLRGVHFGRQLE